MWTTTLLENAGVSKENCALAFELLTGRPVSHKAKTGGRTDVVMIEDLLHTHGIDPGAHTPEERYAALVEAGRRHLRRLQERGHALPGAAESLVRLASEAMVRQSVLTGNVEPNARVKLGAFGLDQWIDFSVGAFGEEHGVRARLVPVAQAKSRELRAAGADAVLANLTDVDALIDAVHHVVRLGATGSRAYEPAG